jgi:hypothetical protein
MKRVSTAFVGQVSAASSLHPERCVRFASASAYILRTLISYISGIRPNPQTLKTGF